MLLLAKLRWPQHTICLTSVEVGVHHGHLSNYQLSQLIWASWTPFMRSDFPPWGARIVSVSLHSAMVDIYGVVWNIIRCVFIHNYTIYLSFSKFNKNIVLIRHIGALWLCTTLLLFHSSSEAPGHACSCSPCKLCFCF